MSLMTDTLWRMKTKIAVLAAASAVLLAGCGQSDDSGEVGVQSWSDWGKLAVQKIDACDESNTVTIWGCWHTAVTELQGATYGLPEDATIDWHLNQYQQDYARLLSRDCATSIALNCQVLQKSPRLIIMKTRELAQEMSD